MTGAVPDAARTGDGPAAVDPALDGHRELLRLAPLIETVEPYKGEIPPVLRDARQDLCRLQDPWNPRAVREQATDLLTRFDRHILAAGHRPWWTREQALLARQHQILRRTRQRWPDPRHRLFYPDAVAAMHELRGLRPGITAFVRRGPQDSRQPDHLLILRRRLAKFVEPKFPPWVAESAAGMLDEFQRRVQRLGYTPWWIVNEQYAATAKRRHVEARKAGGAPDPGDPTG